VTVTRRWVYASHDGTIASIFPKPNDVFPEGYNLIEMRNWQLLQELAQAAKKVEAAQRRWALADQAVKRKADPDLAEKKELQEARGELEVAAAGRAALMQGLVPGPDPGTFFVRAPAFTPEENRLRREYRQEMGLPPLDAGEWTLLSSDFRENLLGKGVDTSTPLLRLGDKSSGWEVEVQIPQKHLYQVHKGYDRMKKERPDDKEAMLDVDLKVRTAPTQTFKGKLPLARIGGEATPQKDDNNEPEPVVTAYILLDHPDIPPEDRVPLRLRTSGTEVLTKIRCGDEAMGYSLFYGVWEFICEKVLFAF
jgi:hypothetical protein